MKLQGYSSLFMIIIFMILFLSQSIKVEGMRPLRDESPPSSLISLIISQAYSGPSHKGRGH